MQFSSQWLIAQAITDRQASTEVQATTVLQLGTDPQPSTEVQPSTDHQPTTVLQLGTDRQGRAALWMATTVGVLVTLLLTMTTHTWHPLLAGGVYTSPLLLHLWLHR